jgi:O-antigen/teichoic acid export membrane protein
MAHVTTPLQEQVNRLRRTEEPEKDLTGRDRLVPNVLFTWATQFVFVIAGFVLPRTIDRRLGQDLLGVWDFSWSLVNYFQLVSLGIASSVNRYVATYRAAHDPAAVNCVVSSASLMLGGAGLVITGLATGVSLLLPYWFSAKLGANLREAQWVVLFLGASLGVQVAFSVFSGVLTGCHQWGLHNLNISGWYAVTVAAMIIALLLGGTLRVLAAITLVGEILTDARRVVLSYRVCEDLQIRPTLARRSMIAELFLFGGKTLIPNISSLLLNQTTSILIISYLGPAALALYSRPRSLVYRVDVLVRKMAMVLVPTTSSLESKGDLDEIRQLVISSTRYSLYMALPIVLGLVIFGGPIMQLWMGSRYANGWIPAILAGGYLAVLAQLPALNILMGLNAHGRAGVARFIASVCAVGLNILVLGHLRWGLVGTAIAVSLPLTVLNLVDIPFLVSRRVSLNIRQYFWAAWAGPLLHTLPLTICLVGARLVLPTRPLLGLTFGGAAGSVILFIVYWRSVLPQQVRMLILRFPRRLVLRVTASRVT